MKIRFATLLFLTPMIAGAAISASPVHNPILSSYTIGSHDDATMHEIARRFEVEKRIPGGFEIIVPASQASVLKQLAPEAHLEVADLGADLRAKVRASHGEWHTFDTVQSDLQQIVKTYPQLASIENYGQSQQGYALNALKLVSSVNSGTAKPRIAITAATHGNELITVEVLFGLVNQLLNGYGKDARLTKMVDTHELYFIPVVNPDGYTQDERYCDGIDPNRDYPYPDDPNHESNPAIQAIIGFFTQHQIQGSIDYHSAAGMIMYPWAYTEDPISDSADEQMFDDLTTKMASFNGYQHGEISRTIYVAPGSSADYYYWKLHAKSLGIEISQDGSPSLIPSMIQENTESTWTFIESF